MICFSTEEEEAQVAITEINTYEGWRGELQKPVRKSREFERQINQIITTRNINKEKDNKISTKQVELSHLKEIKYIKRTLDILLKGNDQRHQKTIKKISEILKKIRKLSKNKSKTQKPIENKA